MRLPTTMCDASTESVCGGVLNWFIRRQYNSSFDDPEKLSRQRIIVWHMPRVALGVCLCLFLLWCVWLQRRSVPVPLDVFKESESVQDPSTFPEAVKQEMRRLLRAVPNGICGVAAPNVRVYTKYLMLRVDGGILLDVFNPVIVRIHPKLNRNVTVREESLMCRFTSFRMVNRMTSIYVQFEDSTGAEHEQHFTGARAVCIQHFMDVFSGVWPCDSYADEYRVPVDVSDVVVTGQAQTLSSPVSL